MRLTSQIVFGCLLRRLCFSCVTVGTSPPKLSQCVEGLCLELSQFSVSFRCELASSWEVGGMPGRAETPRIASDPGRKCATSSRTRLAAQRAAVRRAATRRVVGGTTRPTSWRAPVSTHHSLAPRAIDGPIDPGETIRCAAAALEPGLLPCQPASSQRPLIHRLHSTAFPPSRSALPSTTRSELFANRYFHFAVCVVCVQV